MGEAVVMLDIYRVTYRLMPCVCMSSRSSTLGEAVVMLDIYRVTQKLCIAKPIIWNIILLSLQVVYKVCVKSFGK